MSRFEPGAAGFEAQTLPLCYDSPHLTHMHRMVSNKGDDKRSLFRVTTYSSYHQTRNLLLASDIEIQIYRPPDYEARALYHCATTTALKMDIANNSDCLNLSPLSDGNLWPTENCASSKFQEM